MKNYRLNEISIERLSKLALWLDLYYDKDDVQIVDSGQVLRNTERYKFKVFVVPIRNLPRIFPGEWGVNENGDLIYINDIYDRTLTSMIEFFRIHPDIFRHLFVPHGQYIDIFGGKELTESHTSKDVADNIRIFITNVAKLILKLNEKNCGFSEN